MKKLMIVAAVALLAGMSQAASIAWGNTSSSKLVGLDGSTAITAANATAWGLTVTLMYADGTSTGQSLTAVNSMSAGVLSGTAMNWTYTYSDTETGVGYAKSGTQFYIHAIMKVDGKDYEMDIGKDSPFTIAATDNTGKDTFTWAAGTYGGLSSTPAEGKWSAVPEPTSGLLMLLGMAGLALRRRRA